MTARRVVLRPLAAAAFPLLLLTGCGYISEPLPPLLNIPMPANDLTAVQVADHITVHLTLPTTTTEGKIVRDAPRLDLRIGPKVDATFDANKWASGAQSVPGGVEENGVADFQIPITPWIGKTVQLAIKVIGPSGRDAGWSNPVTLTIAPAPVQPTDLQAEAAPQGVHLNWHGTGKLFEVFRRGPNEEEFTSAGRATTTERTDTAAEFDKAYTYFVQALTTAGESEAESVPSANVEITPKDTFPPAVPAGLRAVPSTSSIELAWERSAGANIVGYRIYRALGNGALQRLSDTEPLPSYSDHQVESGKAYRYAVTAVKRNGLESAMTAAVEATGP